MSVRKFSLLSLLVLLVALSVACGGAAEEPAAESAAEHEAVHWGYEGEGGPEHWGDLEPEYAACKTGTTQSPIDLTEAEPVDLSNVSFNYKKSAINILNNGHTAQVNYDPDSYIEFDGARYGLAQFHYHAPSEHAIDGKLYAAELHLVHKNDAGQLAVIGIMLEEGAENAALQPFIANLPAEESEVQTVSGEIDATGLLPATQTTFRYSGSLTTPPCSEGVSWFVMNTPIQASSAQLSALSGLFEHANNRPVQPLNEREPVLDITN